MYKLGAAELQSVEVGGGDGGGGGGGQGEHRGRAGPPAAPGVDSTTGTLHGKGRQHILTRSSAFIQTQVFYDNSVKDLSSISSIDSYLSI